MSKVYVIWIMWLAFIILDIQAIVRQDFLALTCLAVLIAGRMHQEG
jgi:hypothetical protein